MMPLPAVLRFNAQRQQRKELQRQVERLADENTALRKLLAEADAAAEAAEKRSRYILSQSARSAIRAEEEAMKATIKVTTHLTHISLGKRERRRGGGGLKSAIWAVKGFEIGHMGLFLVCKH
eukprot:scaffold91307_cov27-Prasinocladus_malaysianus.AAC.1